MERFRLRIAKVQFVMTFNKVASVCRISDSVTFMNCCKKDRRVLTYGIEIIHVSNRDERSQLRVAYNSIFRNIFRYSYRESVTDLQHALGRKTWEELLEMRSDKFLRNCALCYDSPLLKALGSIPM